jgi:prefoldin alpha subunit
MASNADAIDARDLQALQMYLNEYGQQAEVMARQLEMIEQRRVESVAAIESMQMLKQEPDGVLLLPLGGGTTVRVKVLDPDKVLVNFGADVVVQRTSDEAKAFLEDRITELEALGKRVTESIDQIKAQMNEIARRIEMGYQQAQIGAGR